MARIAKLLSFLRVTRNGAKVSDVKFDPGGGFNITGEHFAPAGDDAHPLTTDYIIDVDTQRSGGAGVVGYLDPINEPKATPGDKRIYARDPVTGEVVVDIWLKSDGAAVMANSNGSFELTAGGDFIINGVIIAADGSVIIPSSLKVDDKELAGHDHPIAWTDPAGSGTSGPNN